MVVLPEASGVLGVDGLVDDVFESVVPGVIVLEPGEDGVVALPGTVGELEGAPTVDPLPIEPDAGAEDVESGDGEGAAALDDEVVPDDEGTVLGVVVVEFDIELSVLGVSVLLQAPSAASVAARANHLIDRFMGSPLVWVGAA